MPLDAEEKEKKRKKQLKKMGKIIAQIWDLDVNFQDGPHSLTTIGQKIDDNAYKLGRHGWEDFARDLGGVYNRHIHGKTKLANSAKKHLKKVQEMLGAINESLTKAANEYNPESNGKEHRSSDASSNKRKSSDVSSATDRSKKPKSELAAREDRAMNMLHDFITERGGNKSMVHGFRSRVTQQRNKFDVNYFNANGRRFRSMMEIGRHLGLVKDAPVKRNKKTSAQQEVEKKKLRKELERLRKAHQRATKNLDEFQHPVVYNDELDGEDEEPGQIATVAAARIPDMTGFPNIPDSCTPDVLMVWDFLCTFERALALSPIALDDFASALTYMPPQGQSMGDDVDMPVYLAETHLALLKILFQDRSSDDWWWSVLETDETEGIRLENVEEDGGKPVIKIDFAAVLAEAEDPLITASWLRVLESNDRGTFKTSVRTALKVVSNKWVAAYLRKALEVCKTSGTNLAQRAVRWLVRRFREARPDIGERVNKDAVSKARATVLEEATKQMDALGPSAPVVSDVDVVSDFDDEDDSDDESDDEDAGQGDTREESERKASALPPKPLPTLVDLLLPPEKPHPNSDFVDPFTWPHIVGAAATRIVHRKKRILNETDDSLREAQGLAHLTVSERRVRESHAVSRFLTECAAEQTDAIDNALKVLCSGGNYLDLSPVQRLCILRILIEAAYDTGLIHEVVSGNYKQRTGALKALDVEQRRAKREAKEKAVADEKAARERLAAEARDAFLEEMRDEIRQLNAKSKEFPDDVIESLTDEDIIDFDDDIKADYEALPAPESFGKNEVNIMIGKLQEEAAFDTESLRIFSMEELLEREKRELEELEGQYSGFGGEDALLDDSLSRETIRSIERLRRDIERARVQAETLPDQREKAMAELKEALEDGTIKTLRNAYNVAKKAKLVGTDKETGGLWTVDLMRQAALELEKAKQNKRVLDAQKELVAKRNKCFIRTDPIGRDRCGNRFWTFRRNDASAEENSRLWAEARLVVKKGEQPPTKPPPGFLDLVRNPESIAFGARDIEDDFLPRDGSEKEHDFRHFSRQEYHPVGFTNTLARHQWGCHATEDSQRALVKRLGSKFKQERELKARLKESLEETVAEKLEAREVPEEEEDPEAAKIRYEGDQAAFTEAKDAAKALNGSGELVAENMRTGLDAAVRVRHIVDASKDPPVARYENGTVNAWRIRHDKVPKAVEEENEFDAEPEMVVVAVPTWRVISDRGHTFWLTAAELIESIGRFKTWNDEKGKLERDAAFLSFRKTIGRFCGKAADAPFSSSPNYLAKLMINKEGELYPKLKIRSFDNSWGGQSGARALWTNSMKDYAYDFETVKEGLLTLEGAIFNLTGEFTEYQNVEEAKDPEALLNDPTAAFDIELESMEKDLPGLWSSPTSRAVFLYIVKGSRTTGCLALALDLLCRNTMKYLQRHRLLHDSPVAARQSMRMTRRMNTWQQQQDEWF